MLEGDLYCQSHGADRGDMQQVVPKLQILKILSEYLNSPVAVTLLYRRRVRK